ncbi:MAG: response regulator, partial [Pseudobdellovibrionaceae bacterium]
MSTERLDIVKAFLSNEKILLVEPNPIFKQTVVSCLEELGAQREFIFYAKKYNDAVQILKEHTPAVLLTEYYLESRFGLSLVNIQSENSGDKIRIAILVTHNSADSAAAQAAEEEVDDYILKPFSQGELKERLLQVIYKKSNPTEYVHRIREGKKYINAKVLDL